MRRPARHFLCIAFGALFALALDAPKAGAACPSGPGVAEVLESLKRGDGGYVILLRHAEKVKGSDCARIPLTAPGRAQARLIGESFKSLGPAFADKVSKLYHSPCLRTEATAVGILQAAEWSHVRAESESRLRRKSGVKSLRAVLDDTYQDKRNVLIVAHSDEIKRLEGADKLTCGEAAVLSRRMDGAFQCHARLMPYEWNPGLKGEVYWPDCVNHNARRQGRLVE